MNDTTSHDATSTRTASATARRIHNNKVRKARRLIREIADMPVGIWTDAPAATAALVTLATLAPDPSGAAE